MALESVNPPVIITARDFFKIKESTTFRTTGLLYRYLFDLEKKKNLRQVLGINLS